MLGVRVFMGVSLLALLGGCVDGEIMHTAIGNVPKTLTVTSPAFQQGKPIPDRYTCKGEDVSPPFIVGATPREARALAWIFDDPDAPRGTWTHWTAWNVPINMTHVAEGLDLSGVGAVEGMTSAGSVGYHGPCPPSGTHRYFLRVFALREPLSLAEGATRKQLDDVLGTKTTAWGELMGTFAHR